MKNGRRGKEGGKRRGEYEYSVALQRRVRSDSTHLGRKPGAQGWLEALGSGIFFNFSSSPMILFPLPEFLVEAFSLLHGGLQGYPTHSILALLCGSWVYSFLR